MSDRLSPDEIIEYFSNQGIALPKEMFDKIKDVMFAVKSYRDATVLNDKHLKRVAKVNILNAFNKYEEYELKAAEEDSE